MGTYIGEDAGAVGLALRTQLVSLGPCLEEGEKCTYERHFDHSQLFGFLWAKERPITNTTQ